MHQIDKLISINKANLRARLIGTEFTGKPVLVFLHEGLGCIEMWKDFPQLLCQALNLPGLIYDREGYAGSSIAQRPRKPDYLHIEAKESLPLLLKELKIKSPILFGHSDGASIALIFAATYPDWPQGLISEAAHVFVEKITQKGIEESRRTYESTNFRQKLKKYHQEKTDWVFYSWADTWLSKEFSSWNIEKELSSITCPCLIFQGAKDEYATKKQVQSIVTQVKGPVISWLVPNCGHIPHLERSRVVLKTAKNYILKYCLG